MVNKGKLHKLFISLGIKGILCLICLASIGFALVTYAITVPTSPTMQLKQLSEGVTTATWNVYDNEVNWITSSILGAK